MSRNRIIMVTAGIMLSLFLASMESTVVSTAMPTIVGQLGGLEHYSWVFSAYMLTSTTTVPLYGKLSDLYGRRKLYVFAMALFLLGCIASGQANSMTQLILARGLQGVGAGGIMPLAFILIGEMFTLQERARMQGFFSGVWGVLRSWVRCWAVFLWTSFPGAGCFTSTSYRDCSPRDWSLLHGGTKFTVM
ncbi:MAG: MFS transporter [Anaerolineales bacterium]